ncbi:MAG: fibrobacter succinogenes major paralogous domain-containing protein, partial [Candidatus Krumholzibacteria bacterium]|nr:fibrobacter succinogenes major paralogous domain-containing protein [Candidatus Krumholzibacteria bacterium]
DSFTTTALTGTVTDIDGNVYATVKIGDQWWMAENLKVTHYRDGDSIPVVTDDNVWYTLTYGACCAYDNSSDNLDVYGRLYNWRAVSDPRGIAPEGWHVATDNEWSTLVVQLGGASVAGGEMKEMGTDHWLAPNEDANDSAGFTALPGGGRGYMGYFIGLQNNAWFWSATEYSTSRAYLRELSAYDAVIYRLNHAKDYGYSVRCVKD